MKANFSINDIIHIQVVSRLADLLFELQKIDVQGAPLSVQRIHLKAIRKTPPLFSGSRSTYCAESRVRVPLRPKTIKKNLTDGH
jgi:hypothetical protein